MHSLRLARSHIFSRCRNAYTLSVHIYIQQHHTLYLCKKYTTKNRRKTHVNAIETMLVWHVWYGKLDKMKKKKLKSDLTMSSIAYQTCLSQLHNVLNMQGSYLESHMYSILSSFSIIFHRKSSHTNYRNGYAIVQSHLIASHFCTHTLPLFSLLVYTMHETNSKAGLYSVTITWKSTLN